MRRLVIVLLALLALAALAAVPGAADAKKKKPTCARKGSHTLLSTNRSTVFWKGGAANVYACLFKKGKPRRLGQLEECQNTIQASDFRLGGKYVGFESTSCNLDNGDTAVKVIDLKTGHTKWSAPGATGTFGPGDDSTDVTDFEMKPNGSIVWMGYFDQSSNDVGPGDERQVRKLEPGAPAGGTVVDSGMNLVPGSLALSSTTPESGLTPFYWTKGSTPSSSTLH